MTLLQRRAALAALAGSLTSSLHRDAASSDAAPLPARDMAQNARWLASTPASAKPPPSLSGPIRRDDILSYAAPGTLYPIRNIGLQCQGTNATLADVRRLAVHAVTPSGALAQRFGEASVAGRRAFRLQVGADDSLASDQSSRCELVSYPRPDSALPREQAFWLAFTFWADDWAASSAEQSIAQMHVEEPRRIVLNPFFAMVVRGDELRVELRHNASETPDRASTSLVIASRLRMPVRQWMTAVVQARLGADGEGAPFLRLWLDDALVTDYAGPLGYVLGADGRAYWKVGIYHWAAGNAWDLRAPERGLLVHAMLAVRDPDARYGPGTLRGAVNPR